MTHKHHEPASRGPFYADQIHSGDPYELSHGQPIVCLPTGGRGSRANRLGGQVLGTDPAVDSAGVDTGFSPTDDSLRAPDVAVGNIPDAPGWVHGTPPLAVEYADTGQDEPSLKAKISELLAAGTQWVWVVRLSGPRRVEVHTLGQPVTLVQPGGLLRAPGILRNPIPVEALYDETAANEVTLRHLLQRHGYDSLEALREQERTQGRSLGHIEGHTQGQLTSLREVIIQIADTKGLTMDESQHQAIAACTDQALLKRWIQQATVATIAADITL